MSAAARKRISNSDETTLGKMERQVCAEGATTR